MKQLNNTQASIINSAAQSITRKALKTMESRGSAKAAEILNTYQHTLFEDLMQEVVLTILENLESIRIISKEKRLEFLTLEAKKAVFQVVQRTLYQMQQKHYRHIWIHNNSGINSKGETESASEILEHVMYTQAVRQHELSVSAFDVRNLVEELTTLLTDKQSQVFALLLQEYTMQQIADILDVSKATVQQRIEAIRRKCKALDITE